jgi:1,4-alpha-glucan branching enzyme
MGVTTLRSPDRPSARTTAPARGSRRAAATRTGPAAENPPVAPSQAVTSVPAPPVREPSDAELAALTRGEHADPHTILGPHPTKDGKTRVRGLFPAGAEVTIVSSKPGRLNRLGLPQPGSEERVKMTAGPAGAPGLLEATIPSGAAYHFEIGGKKVEDPYRFPPTVSDLDLYLFKQGTLEDAAHLLGAHAMTVDGVKGFNFVVWAPNARGVSVVGDWNGWDPALSPMRKLGNAVYEIFVPNLGDGAKYLFSVAGQHGGRVLKADPAARTSEVRPFHASITAGADGHVWGDDAFMKARAASDPLKVPMSTYEVHLPSWKRRADGSMMSYRELADALVPHLKEHGFNAIELVGLAEHPLDDSWGYQVTGYYAPTSRHGTPAELKYFVDKMHQAGVRVMYDWVPAHFPKDPHALATFDGTHLFDHQDPRLGEHMDWGTRIFNYGRNEVKSFLIGGLMHMLDEYHLDGIRVDAVASMLYRDYSRKDWIPNEDGSKENREAIAFLRDVNARVGKRFPGVLRIAEESTAFPGVTTPVDQGGLGFDLKWNMGWMHDTLEFFKAPTHERAGRLDQLTNTFLWAHSEKFVAALSHDEVVHLKRSLLEKMPGDEWQKRANLRLLFGFMFSYPGQKLLFMGSELGQKGEWDFKTQLDWAGGKGAGGRGIGLLLSDLNRLYRDRPALSEKQFDPAGTELFLRDTKDAIVGMVRKGARREDDLVFLHNLTEHPRRVRVGVDAPGAWREAINTDAKKYGGSGVENGSITAEAIPANGKPYSVMLTLPPLGTLALERG